MKYILDQENIKYEDKALAVIAQVADGGMRDALSILDQLLSYEKGSVNYDDALQITGFAAKENIEKILLALLDQDAVNALKLTQSALDEGASSKNILDELIDMATKSLMLIKTKEDQGTFLTENFVQKIQDVPTSRYYRLITLANNALNDLRYTNQQQIPLKVFLVEASSDNNVTEEKAPAAAPKVEVKAANTTAMQAELSALKDQVNELTQKLTQISKKPSFNKDQVFHLDTAVPKPERVQKVVKKPETAVKRPVKKVKKTTAENRKQVYHVLEHATRKDLEAVKNVWPDLQSVLAVSERALLDVLEPVAASPDQVVMKCKYTLWFENASSDSDLLTKLTDQIERFAKHHYGIVLVPDEDWLAVRKEFVESHKEELLAKKKQKIEEDNKDAEPKEDAKVVDTAKELFGDAVTIKD